MLKVAMAALAITVVAGIASPAAATLPEGKVAVVRVTAIDGLALAQGPVSQTRTSAFAFDGTTYTLESASLGSLDGVETLLLIDRRRDEASGGGVTQVSSQEVRALPGTAFVVEDVPGKKLQYQVAMIGGNLRLMGPGDQILATGGDKGPYTIWKIEDVDLVSKSAITLR
jgi:hypothetical protein